MLDQGFYFIRSRQTQLSLSQAKTFYQQHSDRFFFNRLTHFMSSGPISLHILGKRDAVKEWRRLLGPTKVTRAQFESEDSIRGRYGISDTRNVAHGSDALETALMEIAFFFPHFDALQWAQRHLPSFVKSDVVFDADTQQHRMKSG